MQMLVNIQRLDLLLAFYLKRESMTLVPINIRARARESALSQNREIAAAQMELLNSAQTKSTHQGTGLAFVYIIRCCVYVILYLMLVLKSSPHKVRIDPQGTILLPASHGRCTKPA